MPFEDTDTDTTGITVTGTIDMDINMNMNSTASPTEMGTMGDEEEEFIDVAIMAEEVTVMPVAVEEDEDNEPAGQLDPVGILEMAGQNGVGNFPLQTCQGDCDNDGEVSLVFCC